MKRSRAAEVNQVSYRGLDSRTVAMRVIAGRTRFFARKNMQRPQDGSIRLEWLALRQVRRYANISERTLRNWIHSPVNPLPAVRVRGKILVKRSELDLWLERHRIRALDRVDLDGMVREVLQGLAHGR